MTKVPLIDLKRQYERIRTDVDAAVLAVLARQDFVLGKEVGELEAALARLVGTRHAVSCASGTDALVLALMALQIGQGDEVICPAFTFIATAGAVVRTGARPVFADIDPETLNIDPAAIERAVTPRTRAIIPVHLFGHCAEMDPIIDLARRRGIHVIEDAAQAIGSTYRGREAGSLGTMGCFSFFPTKNLGGAGDGGFVTTDDDRLAKSLRCLRVHGSRDRYVYEKVGLNSRLDTIQAAVLLAKLPHINAWNEARAANAAAYDRSFAGTRVRTPAARGHCRHTYHQYTIRHPARDLLASYLGDRGIGNGVYYPIPLHLQEAFSSFGGRPGDLPESERASREVLSVPVFPELHEAERRAVIDAVLEFERSQRA